MIPKIIHYCWLSDDPIPNKLQSCIDSWHKFLPDYEFVLWDRNRFDVDKIPWTKQAFESKKYAFAADYIRLYAVYTYGGIYMDMDVEVVRPFDPFLSNSYILGYERKESIEAGVFGGEKGAMWIKKCLDYYNDRNFINPDGSFNIRPLPRIMFDCLEEERKIFDIYPNDYLTAKSYETGIVTVTENTFAIHHFAGSWVSDVDRYAHELKKKLTFLPKSIRIVVARFCSRVRYNGFVAAYRELANKIWKKIK